MARFSELRRSVTTVGVLGVAIMVVSSVGIATAATGGAFILGRTNTATTTTVLKDSTSVPLSLYGPSNRAPLAVNSGVKVTNLNADKLDGLDSTQLQRKIPAIVWHNFTLLNGWATYGPGYGVINPQYTKDAFGFVHLRGTLTGTSSTSDVLATLPSGFFPSTGAWVAIGSTNGASDPQKVNLWIDSSGNVHAYKESGANFAFVSLEGANFFVG